MASTPRDCGCAADHLVVVGRVGRLVHEHRGRLAAVARAEGLRPADAFDVVQEAFGRFLQLEDAARLTDAPDEAQRVLGAIVRNLARNARRLAAEARPHDSDPALLDGLPAPDPDVEELLGAAEERLRLQGCVASLADLQRAVVTLRMLEELDGDDVAATLGITPGHVAVLLHRAKANLATCMSQEELEMNRLIEVTDDNFDQEVLASEVPVLVDFTSAWCPPCRAIAPHVQALATDHAGRLRVGTCDVDSNNGLVARLDVRSMPTLFMVFKQGRVVGQIVGAVPRAKLDALVAKAFG